MAEKFSESVLKVVVAQICQNIGWHSIGSFPLEILTDVLRRYIIEIGLLSHRYCEQSGRSELSLEDLKLAFKDLSINIAELEEYVNNVEPVPFIADVPKYPVHNESDLKFLKPGSCEVLYRPLHVSEHLPPMYPEMEDSDYSKSNGIPNEMSPYRESSPVSSPGSTFRKPSDVFTSESPGKKIKSTNDDEGRPLREIISVMMTSNGYLSPAREGKLPEKKINDADFYESESENEIVEEISVPSVDKSKKTLIAKKSYLEINKKNHGRELETTIGVEHVSDYGKETPKLAAIKETSKLKMFKLGNKNSKSAGSSKNKSPSQQSYSAIKNVKSLSPKQKMNKPLAVPTKADKPVLPIELKIPSRDKDPVAKIPSLDPDKQKLNIFKKMIAGKVKDGEKKECVDYSKDSILSTKSDVDDIIEEVVKKSAMPIDKEDKKREKKDRKDKRKLENAAVEKADRDAACIDKNGDRPKVKEEKTLEEIRELSAKQAKEIEDTISAVIDMAKSPEPCAVVEDDFSFASPPRTPTTPRTPELPPISKSVEKITDKKKRKQAKEAPERAKSRKSKSPKKISREDAHMDRPNTPELDRDIKMDSEPLDMSKSNSFSKAPPHPTFIPNPNLNPVFGQLPSFPYNFPGGPPAFPFPPSIPPTLLPGFSFPPAKSDVSEDKKSHATTSEKKLSKLDTRSDNSVDTPKQEKVKQLKRDKKENDGEVERTKKRKKDKNEKVIKEKKPKEEKKERPIKQDKSDGASLPKITLKFSGQAPSPGDDHQVLADCVSPSQDNLFSPDIPEIALKPSKKLKEDKAEDRKKDKVREKDVVPKDKFKKKDKVDIVVPSEDISPLGSPELAKFSPLTPVKPKVIKDLEPEKTSPKSDDDKKKKLASIKSKKQGVKTKKVEDVVLITETVGSYIDESGNKVWICPSCGKQDDGSPMIGCDDCDDWYHWVCVGIQVPPDEHENWYCKRCIVKKRTGGSSSNSNLKKGRKKSKLK